MKAAHVTDRARRLGFRIKAIIIGALLVGASLAIVAAFAAGFVTGSFMAIGDQRDQCRATGGNWDADGRVCIAEVRVQAEAPQQPGTSYECGDGTRFTLTELEGGRMSYQEASSTPRELAQQDPAANIMTYEDGELSVTLAGPEARLRDLVSGKDVSCIAR